MRTGQLRHRLELRKPVQSIDSETGADSYIFTPVTKRWGAIEQLTGNEEYSSGQVVEEATHKITIRFCKELEATWKIKFGTREFSIKGIWILDEIKRFQVVFVAEVK